MNRLQGRYIIACSGGPDSMALFDLARKRGLDLVCAHVNYHKRDSAQRDEDIVRKYCDQYGIPFEKRDYEEETGNFQDNARKTRYRFFAELVKKYDAKGVLVAHHLDDLLETYYLQKEHGGSYDHLGLKRRGEIAGVGVIRPLLRYTKKDLLEYCGKEGIPYGIDESNLEDHYARNRIRHEIVEKMTEREKRKKKREIDEENRKIRAYRKEVKKWMAGRMRYPVTELQNCPFKEDVLRELLYTDLAQTYLSELCRQISTSKNFSVEIRDKVLVKEYGEVEVFPKEEDYAYVMEELRFGKYPYFALRKKGKTAEALTLSPEDYPITIRNAKEGDEIVMRYGRKKVSRFFIDRKIPLRERLMWPVVENAKGDIVYVCQLGCDKTHHSVKPSMFMIK